MLSRKLIMLIVLVISLCSCQPLNNENQYGGFEVGEDNEPLTEEQENQHTDVSEEQAHQEDENPDTNEPLPDQEDTNEDQQMNEAELIEEEEVESQPPTNYVEVPFSTGDFIGRWNAISDEYTFDKKITTLDYVNNDEESYYFTNLSHSQLKIFVNLPDNVYRIQLLSSGDSKNQRFSMITSWWQLLLTMNPDMEPHEIDIALNDLNIGANADMSSLNTEPVPFQQQQFQVNRSENNYIFTLSFTESGQLNSDEDGINDENN